MSMLVVSFLKQLVPPKPKVEADCLGPWRIQVPTHLSVPEESRIWCEAHVKIKNVSNRTLSSIRIKLGRSMAAPPVIDSRECPRCTSEYAADLDEVEIENLDPKTAIYVTAFLPVVEQRMSFAPTLIVDGELHPFDLSGFWYWFELIKFKPLIFAVAMLVSTTGLVAYAYIRTSSPCLIEKSAECYIKKATDRIAGSCTFDVEKVTTATEGKIRRTAFPRDLTMFINQATSLEELLSRDTIVICNAKSSE